MTAKDQVADLARLLRAAAPLAEYLNSDEVPESERSRLRELVGGDNYFELSNNLTAMCSSRARALMRAETEEERQQIQEQLRKQLSGVRKQSR